MFLHSTTLLFALGLSQTLAASDPHSKKTVYLRHTSTHNPNAHPSHAHLSHRAFDHNLPRQDDNGWIEGPCLVDQDNPRLLLVDTKSDTNNPEWCISTCASQSYSIAGVQDGDQCWCGNTLMFGFDQFPQSLVTSESDCNDCCPSGDGSTCGGLNRMKIFAKNDTLASYGYVTPIITDTSETTKRFTVPAGWDQGPCLIDQTSPSLLSMDIISDAANPEWCMQICVSHSFTIAGTEKGNHCWCGNSLSFSEGETPNSRVAPDSECTARCISGGENVCGGESRVRIYGQNGALNAYNFNASQPNTTSTATSTETTATTDTNAPSTTRPSGAATSKLVVAHHMVGNTLSYNDQTWLSDVRLAKEHSIDGFALNVGPGSWQRDQVAKAYNAAASAGNFGMFMSFDMTAMSCANQNDASILRDYLITWGSASAQLTLPPRPGSTRARVLVSTFSGENCNFGTSSPRDGWASILQDSTVVKALASANREVAFLPSWFTRIETRNGEFGTGGDISQGDFNWNSGWPTGATDVSWDLDSYHLRFNTGPLYMTSVAPWFFTHYGPDSYNKNWIYRGDDWHYAGRWEQLITHRDQIDIAQIVTWNDYGESSYIGPIKDEQPNSQAWVNGYPHIGWLSMTDYYAQAFKTGTYPTIQQNKVFIWSRPHRKDSSAPDGVGRPANWQWTDDYLWAVVFSTGPGTFELRSGSNVATFNVVPGVNKFKVANSPGTIRGVLKDRKGAVITDVNPGSSFTFTEHPSSYNFNAYVAQG